MIDITYLDIFLWLVACGIAGVFIWLFIMELVDDYRFRRDRDAHDDRGKDAREHDHAKSGS